MGKEKLVGKIVMSGKLTVESPLLIGAGQEDYLADNDRDIHVLRVADSKKRNAETEHLKYVIPGTSLAGVLRDLVARQSKELTAELFGELSFMQSSLEVSDIVLENAKLTYRDGVSIDENLGSAIDGAKYDYEAIERGAWGELRLVITIKGIHTANPGKWQSAELRPEVLNAVYYLKDCLEEGISLGAMTAKGLGRVRVKNLQAGLYDFADSKDVAAWLSQEVPEAGKAGRLLQDKSSWRTSNLGLTVEAEFALQSSLIVRDYGSGTKTEKGKKVVFSLKSGGDYVIPGTSIKGVLRHQAAYILDLLGDRKDMLESLMGTAEAKSKTKETEGRIKSRFYVDEAYIVSGKKGAVAEAEVTRNRIDRFTGGTIESALFTEMPLWQKDERIPTVRLRFSVREADEKEAGLALFLLKDLWQGKVALGGEAGVGRGTLKGLQAKINYRGQEYELDKEGQVVSGQPEELEKLAAAFASYAKGEV